MKGSGRCAGNSLSMSQTPLHAELHTAYAAVAPLSTKYPAQEGALFQTFVDLKYAARWRFLEVHDVQRSEIADPALGFVLDYLPRLAAYLLSSQVSPCLAIVCSTRPSNHSTS